MSTRFQANLITLPHLLANDGYSVYFKSKVRTFQSSGPRWQIVTLSNEGKWGNGLRDTFKDAYRTMNQLLDTGKYHDLSLVSRNRLFRPPPADVMADLCGPEDDWCYRCRRPSRFIKYGSSHHALKYAPVIVPGVVRCYFCGINQDYALMGKR